MSPERDVADANLELTAPVQQGREGATSAREGGAIWATAAGDKVDGLAIPQSHHIPHLHPSSSSALVPIFCAFTLTLFALSVAYVLARACPTIEEPSSLCTPLLPRP